MICKMRMARQVTTESTLAGNRDVLMTHGSDFRLGGLSGEFTLDIRPFGLLPIQVVVDDDGSFLAVELLTGSYGVGATMQGALAALHDAVVRHHAFLVRTGRDQLSERLQVQLETLQARAATTTTEGTSVGTRSRTGGNRQLALAA